MESTNIRQLRNIGIMAHIDAGKTTTTERILYFTGLTHKMGEVHNGNAVMDWMIQEQERGITITSASTSCYWNDHHINIIDTPGHVDFTVEVERCLRVLDGAIFLLDAKEGVEAQTKVVWHQAQHYDVPRMIFINKMDTIGADFKGSVASVKSQLGANPVPVQIPVGQEKDFDCVISLVTMKAYYNAGELGEEVKTKDIPEAYLKEAKEYRKHLLEAVAEQNDTLLLMYLEGEPIPEDLLIEAIRSATIKGSITPILCGSAFKNKGIQLLLDAIISYLPSPLERPLIKGKSHHDHTILRKPDNAEPFSALVFKIMTDPYVGRLTYIRIYSGTLQKGSSILNASKDKKVRINKLLQMHANHRQEIDTAQAGDIVAVIGLKYAGTGDTLADLNHPILLESIHFPEPVISMALEPKKPGDYDKMRESLELLSQEDPTLKTYIDDDTGQTILSGMGELHLEIILDRLSKEFSVTVNSGTPRVNYKESITKPAKVDYTLSQGEDTQSVYAYIALQVSPRERGSGHNIHTKVSRKKIPEAFIEAAEEGIRRSLASGILVGYEVIDLDVEITGLDYMEDQSNEVAFMTAAAFALNEALREGQSTLLEPFFTLSVHVPDTYIGDVMDDIKKRKGNITNIEVLPNYHKISAIVPLSNLFGYATDIRSITRGNGHYTMLFSHYDPVIEV